MHGTIHPLYGSPEFGAWISRLREFDIALPPDDLVMGLPESWTDTRLYRRLSWVMSKAPQHVAIIGYSFAQMGSGYDDAVTMACFVHRFRHYPGAIFVVSPDPTQLCEMLSDALEIKTVYPIKRYWNEACACVLWRHKGPGQIPIFGPRTWISIRPTRQRSGIPDPAALGLVPNAAAKPQQRMGLRLHRISVRL